MNTRPIRTTRWLLLAALASALAGGGLALHQGAVGQDVGKRSSDVAPIEHAKGLSAAFRKAAEIALPTVVTVHSKSRPQRPADREQGERNRRGPRANPFEGTPFEDFFDEFGGEGFDLRDFDNMPRRRRQGVGSGVIIDAAGVVLTNNHVVEGADEVEVHLADGRVFKAEDIRRDENTDLAVLKIKGAGTLPAAKLGDSDKLDIGDWVIAVGAPFELEQTVSAGIISGKGRSLAGIRAGFLQTDAAINPGNSGGPLLSLDGEVVGINSAIATQTGSFAGIGFAVPANVVKWVVPQLLEKGTVQRAYLGVSIGEVDHDLAEQLGVKPGEGVLVNEVTSGSPAAAAGVKEQDVIVRFDGRKVRTSRELQDAVERVPLDSKHKLEVIRDRKPITLEIAAKPLPKDLARRLSPTRPGRARAEGDSFRAEELGVEVSEVTAEEAEKLGLAAREGVVITEVDPDSVAAEKGLSAGMMITRVGSKEIQSVAEFEKALEGQTLKKGVLLFVRTRAGNRILVLKE